MSLLTNSIDTQQHFSSSCKPAKLISREMYVTEDLHLTDVKCFVARFSARKNTHKRRPRVCLTNSSLTNPLSLETIRESPFSNVWANTFCFSTQQGDSVDWKIPSSYTEKPIQSNQLSCFTWLPGQTYSSADWTKFSSKQQRHSVNWKIHPTPVWTLAPTFPHCTNKLSRCN